MTDLSEAFGNDGFDPSTVDPNGTDFPIIPAGDYIIQLVEGEMVPVKDKPHNKFLKVQFEIMEGEHERFKLFDNLNLINDNDKTVIFARQRLSQICHAAGKGNERVRNVKDLEFIPMWATVEVVLDSRDKDIKPSDPNYANRRWQNKIKKFFVFDGAQQGGRSPSASAAGAASGGGRPAHQGAGMGSGATGGAGAGAAGAAAGTASRGAPWKQRAAG